MVPEFETAAFALEVGKLYEGAGAERSSAGTSSWSRTSAPSSRRRSSTVKDQIRNLVFREKYFALVNELRDGGEGRRGPTLT